MEVSHAVSGLPVALLGISAERETSGLVVSAPLLTPKIRELEIKNLRGLDWEADLLFHRRHRDSNSEVTAEVRRKTGSVRISPNPWPGSA